MTTEYQQAKIIELQRLGWTKAGSNTLVGVRSKPPKVIHIFENRLGMQAFVHSAHTDIVLSEDSPGLKSDPFAGLEC